MIDPISQANLASALTNQARSEQLRERIGIVRLQIAGQIMASIMPGFVRAAIAEAHHEVDPLGVGQEKPDGFQIDLGTPAGIAAQATDALLVTLGVIPPPARPAPGGASRIER